MANEGYLTDHNGKPSSMRLMSFVSLFSGVGLTVLIGVIVYQGQDPENISFLFNLILVWIVGAFAPKAIQKYVEGAFFRNSDMPSPGHSYSGDTSVTGSSSQPPEEDEK